MGEWRRATVALGLALLCVSPAAPARAENPEAEVRFRWDDVRIAESSGLAFSAGLLVTTNDSGAGPVLYAVDPRTGATVSTTTFTDGAGARADVVDVEALAPARGGVWVGDVGDNTASRDTVTVYRVPLSRAGGTVAARSYALRYVDGARDAETLLVDRRTGRLYVVSKDVGGATVYAAPRRLDPDGVGVLRPVGQVPGWLTDGQLLADGRTLLVRDYGGATAYTWPGLARLVPVGLPAQRQGEALTVRGAQVWVSTEGSGSAVETVPLPALLRARAEQSDPADPADRSGATAVRPVGSPARPSSPPTYAAEPATGLVPGWAAGAAPWVGVLVVAALLGGWLRERRR